MTAVNQPAADCNALPQNLNAVAAAKRKELMMLNRPITELEPLFECEILHPGGSRPAYLSREEVEVYNRDPDAYAAGLFGLTKDEYVQWVTKDGNALCGERTKSGRQCNSTVSAPPTAAEWKKTHRQSACHAHSNKGGRVNG
jgi:hypothetical protein